eukprot:CAMPEP_0201507952 /NCGR_PEP_ID=MMETSP0161_2-20130828/1452_1 /ASSEMBLY_ACC=CAM_ASM_000251 /TAXON_ID=180227 /ORGANISM="Neoparamoeba aestuarina, Strain SoJaBio B1-5/56/2" /LENGTH=209 /DNA_ID=CAMNT_0047902451 /DNA_START=22 /DNA_END=651 /DNA_ORIENTATION=+
MSTVLDIPFLGAVVPREISSLAPLMKEISEDDFARVLRFTLFYLAGSATEEEEEHRWNNELKNLTLAPEKAGKFFTGLFLLLRSAFRTSVPVPELKNGLKALSFNGQQADSVCDEYKKTSSKMVETFFTRRIKLPSVTDTNWRTEVVITSSSMKRVMRPAIFMELTLSDGTIKQFEVDAETFHKLRYNVANVLRDISDLEKAPILKIDK